MSAPTHTLTSNQTHTQPTATAFRWPPNTPSCVCSAVYHTSKKNTGADRQLMKSGIQLDRSGIIPRRQRHPPVTATVTHKSQHRYPDHGMETSFCWSSRMRAAELIQDYWHLRFTWCHIFYQAQYPNKVSSWDFPSHLRQKLFIYLFFLRPLH